MSDCHNCVPNLHSELARLCMSIRYVSLQLDIAHSGICTWKLSVQLPRNVCAHSWTDTPVKQGLQNESKKRQINQFITKKSSLRCKVEVWFWLIKSWGLQLFEKCLVFESYWKWNLRWVISHSEIMYSFSLNCYFSGICLALTFFLY